MSRGLPAFFRQFWLHFRKNFRKNLGKVEIHFTTHGLYYYNYMNIVISMGLKMDSLDLTTMIQDLRMTDGNQECSCDRISMSKWFVITIQDSNAASATSSKFKYNVSTKNDSFLFLRMLLLCYL